MTTTAAFHHPPELLSLLIDTIPLLCRSKDDVLLFFQGCGVPEAILAEHRVQLATDRQSVRKHHITRAVLTRLNEGGDNYLRQRREVLKRVTEFEDFSTCWPADQLKAKGLVAGASRVRNVKDSFTRMQLERDAERQQRMDAKATEASAMQQRQLDLDDVQRRLSGLFSEQDPHHRGKTLESVLNRLFEIEKIRVREAFTISGDHGEGIIEQVDGVIELAGELYLVEMKWHNHPLGVEDVSNHIVRLYGRSCARGIFISASGYTAPAIDQVKQALTNKVIVLCELRELVFLLERRCDMTEFWRRKVHAAVIDKNPLSHQL